VTSARARVTSRVLVVVEMSLALALVAAAGLLAKSVMRLQSQDLGFTREPVLTFGVGLPPLTAPDDATIARIHTEFVSRLRALPGVTRASAISLLPIARTGTNGPVFRAEESGDGERVPVTEFRAVMDGYFETMDVRVMAGRGITGDDSSTSAPVAVLNETLASRLFPGVELAQTIGRRIRIGWLGKTTSEVIGVVASVRSRRPDAPPDPEVYIPVSQAPSAFLSYVVRGGRDVAALLAPIRRTLADVAPGVPLATVRTLDDIVSTSTRLSRLISWLSVIFGILAATLAVLGVYSVLSYGVAQRTREFAIRAAVGASRSRIVALVLREGAMMSGLGIVLGTLLGLQASGLLSHLLFGVSATDPVVFALAAMGLAAVSAGGYLIPAMRASRVEASEALRGE
jgi:putative ABC transport system permease protein